MVWPVIGGRRRPRMSVTARPLLNVRVGMCPQASWPRFGPTGPVFRGRWHRPVAICSSARDRGADGTGRSGSAGSVQGSLHGGPGLGSDDPVDADVRVPLEGPCRRRRLRTEDAVHGDV